jgi:hypothetical protein
MHEEKQHRNLLFNGTCIADRRIGNTQVLLFQLYSFYVEVYFNEEGDEVVYTRGFEDIEELEPYLNQIELKGIQ